MSRNLTFETIRADLLASNAPSQAARAIAALPTPLPSGFRAHLTDAVSVFRRRGASWAPVVDAVRALAFDDPRSPVGHVCSTCMVDYSARADRGGVGGLRTMARVFNVGADGRPDPDTRGQDGAPYGAPVRTDEPRYAPTPIVDADGNITGWDAYINVRQNACSMCRGFVGEERVAVLTDGGIDAYREAVAQRWSDYDARAEAARVKAEETARARAERAARAPRRPPASPADVADAAIRAMESMTDVEKAAFVARILASRRGAE